MASIFTYDPDPPRVSSPWSTPGAATPLLGPVDWESQEGSADVPEPIQLSECGITKLEAEPQEGPIEYKLHLLLRQRRSFTNSSTGHRVSGSHQSKPRSSLSEYASSSLHKRASPGPVSNTQSRQNRLQNLTTQLLWRLQQSSPYHSSSKADLVLPVLPETALDLSTPMRPGKVLAGLEESQGALYEIGVSDDGTFVGITKDEMEESLMNLRSMAASLGCKVQILRNVIVGNCEWTEEFLTAQGSCSKVHTESLWVAEALVLPNTHFVQKGSGLTSAFLKGSRLPMSQDRSVEATVKNTESQTAQLRVSLTGSTTSGKSSLLGTLTTSTLDNGRGKSRLSLLKHRHEIASGITSSVALELIGYQARSPKSYDDDDDNENSAQIINYGTGNISSWTDIHHRAEGGRLVLLTDSAGHPRYRRTTVRGLVSWAPHWTICCVAADDDEDSAGHVGATASAQDVLGEGSAHIDLSKAHLEFCLKLGLSLIVVVTKFDLASKAGLKQTLTKVLSLVKDAGRRPVLLPVDTNVTPDTIPLSSEETVQNMLESCTNIDLANLVPIVLTSAVAGNGVGTLHALLRYIPILSQPLAIEGPYERELTEEDALFHIDEVFTKTEQTAVGVSQDSDFIVESSYVLSGHLRRGRLRIGDELYIGPFAPDVVGEEARRSEMYRATSSTLGHLTTESGRGQVVRRQLSGNFTSLGPSATRADSTLTEGWHQVRILSIRNLRLPVRHLLTDQVGTIGIVFSDGSRSPTQRIRKGMILGHPRRDKYHDNLIAYGGFSACFKDLGISLLPIGASIIIYVASVRSSAKIISIEGPSAQPHRSKSKSIESDDMFGFDDSGSDDGGVGISSEHEVGRCVEVTFQFTTYREWLEVGTQVLVMPGGSDRRGESNARLEGYVGKITEAIT